MTTTEVQLAVTGMHCSSCGLLIDEVLEDLEGVTRSGTDSRRGTTTVAFDASCVSVDDLIEAIAEVGYGACPMDNGA